jgi:hypothetical protein
MTFIEAEDLVDRWFEKEQNPLIREAAIKRFLKVCLGAPDGEHSVIYAMQKQLRGVPCKKKME